MNLKQKFSVFTAMALPALALSSFFLTTSVKARTIKGHTSYQCDYYSPGNFPDTCETGSGVSVPVGQSSIFVFCPNGWGTCEDSDGCVQCQ